jgi:hypothetical protein
MIQDPPKKRGRPVGSRNKFGAAGAPVTAEKGVSVRASTAPSPPSSLRAQYEATAAKLEEALSRAIEPKEIASIATALNRTRWHVGQLTGEATITESKIVRSEAWTALLGKLTPILARHPACLAEVTTFLESIVEV